MHLLYIDPGTGSMLFAVLIGILGALGYALSGLLVKLRFVLNGGKKTNDKNEKVPLIIFSDDKRYWNTFEPICRLLDEKGVRTLFMTASADDEALKEEFDNIVTEYIGDGNRAFAKLNFASADVLLATTPGLDVYQWKRSKNIKYYVHIPHMSNDITFYRMFGTDYYDSVLVSNDFQADEVRKLEKLRKLPQKELVKVGIPYMDKMLQRLNNTVVSDDNRTTILLAPTWGDSSLFKIYGESLIDSLINTGYKLIIRPHPQSFKSEEEMIDRLMKKYPDSKDLEWNKDTDNFDVLNRCDILISDFSGVIFDFALVFDKPVIYSHHDFDISTYDAWWLNGDLWTFKALPRLGTELKKDDLVNIKDIIDNCINNPKFSQSRKEVIHEAWAEIGKGAENTVNYLVNKLEEINKTEN